MWGSPAPQPTLTCGLTSTHAPAPLQLLSLDKASCAGVLSQKLGRFMVILSGRSETFAFRCEQVSGASLPAAFLRVGLAAPWEADSPSDPGINWTSGFQEGR